MGGQSHRAPEWVFFSCRQKNQTQKERPTLKYILTGGVFAGGWRGLVGGRLSLQLCNHSGERAVFAIFQIGELEAFQHTINR